MNNSLIQDLTSKTSKFRAYMAEKASLESRECELAMEIQQASNSTTAGEGEISRRIEKASQTLIGVRARLSAMALIGRDRLEDLKKALRRADDDFSRSCEISARILNARFTRHNLKFFGGDEEAARLACADIAPGTIWRENLWKCDEQSVLRATEGSILKFVESFSSHLSKVLPTLIPLESARESEQEAAKQG